MENNDLLKKSFYSYPKSLNHKVLWKKNDKIKTCDLGSNCSEFEFSIRQNKLVKHKIFNNNVDVNKLYYSDEINDRENFTCISCMGINSKIITNLINYNTIVFFLLSILIIVLNLKSRK